MFPLIVHTPSKVKTYKFHPQIFLILLKIFYPVYVPTPYEVIKKVPYPVHVPQPYPVVHEKKVPVEVKLDHLIYERDAKFSLSLGH